MATIGYGHAVPLTTWGKAFAIVYVVIGVPLTMILFDSIVERLECMVVGSMHSSRRKSSRRDYSGSVVGAERALYWKCAGVFFVLVVFVYLVPAAILSKYTEPDWTFFDAIYFCFVSISTIGFGKCLRCDFSSQSSTLFLHA